MSLNESHVSGDYFLKMCYGYGNYLDGIRTQVIAVSLRPDCEQCFLEKTLLQCAKIT